MKYKVELRIRNQAGEAINCPTDGRRHRVLVHAWASGMEAAKTLAAFRRTTVCVRILDHRDEIAVTGRVEPPNDSPPMPRSPR